MPKIDPEILLIAFVAVTGLAVLLQAILLLAIFLTIRKAANKVSEQAEELRSALMPIIYNTRDLFARVAPKLESAVDDLAEIAEGLRLQTADVQLSVTDLLERFRLQTTRIDGLFSSLLDAVDRAGGFIAEVVSRPVRQISAMLSSVKAVVESLRKSAGDGRPTQPNGERDMFV
jgi:uncharacterized protein YoxC